MNKIKNYIFVERPIFATVISIIITLAGIVALKGLPVEQFPSLTPPQISVSARYSGASAEIMAENVASVLEAQINGVENMIYMSSVNSSGSTSISVTFDIGTDQDQALIDVNNRVQLALASLPQEVQRLGVTVEKRSSNIVLLVGLYSPDGRYDTIYLNNYAKLNVIDALKLTTGVGSADTFSRQDYAIRLWLDTQKMGKYNISTAEVIAAVQSQNVQFAAGSLGTEPMIPEAEITWQLVTNGRFSTADEFKDIIVRTATDGSILYLGDIARIELGGEDYSVASESNGNPNVAIGIYLSPGANALETVTAIREKMDELSLNFPDGVAYEVLYDTTKFIEVSIEEVVKTLIEAVVLVVLVIFLFLQNWRATLIPTIAVPVSIIGTFAGMYVLGFSINTLTMFGLVLAIGMVVDDAIIVLENVERHMAEGKSPKEATTAAMGEVAKPVIAIVFVLSAVFLPVAFTGGLAGQMYKQFSITIIVSVVISGIVALSFTPALCATLLKNTHHTPSLPFRLFNTFFEKSTEWYTWVVTLLLKNGVATVLLFIVMSGCGGFLLTKLPTGLVPQEDQGFVIGFVSLPDGAVLSRTKEVATQLQQEISKDPTVQNLSNIMGFNVIGGSAASNYATMFVTMTDWDERPEPSQSSSALVGKIMQLGSTLPEGYALAFNPPPIQGLSITGGFEVYVQNRAGDSIGQMADVMQKFTAALNQRPEITGINSSFSLTQPQLRLSLDREAVNKMGINVSDVFSTMQATFGATYVNDFNLYGRTFRVFAQADAPFRVTPNDFSDVFVKNAMGEMVPLSAVLKVEMEAGVQNISRFNNFPAVRYLGSPNVGYTSSETMIAVEEVAREVLPQNYTLAWAGSSYQERETSGNTMIVFMLALIMVFLILAAQYESWSLPITVVSAVPFALLGAALATWGRGLMNDIYFQVAIVTLVGLAAKNAILIVEFAVEKHRQEGLSLVDSAIEAARLRFRPIVMTSLAFIVGCIPLAISTGAGANSRHSIGTAVIGGMIFATVLAPLFVPYFFKLVMGIANKLTGEKK